MLTKVFTRVTFSNVIEFKKYFPNLEFWSWLQWRWEKSSLFHLHCCATGQCQNSSGQQQWLGSCIARLPAHYCCAAAMVAAVAGARSGGQQQLSWRAAALLHSLRWGCATALKLCVCLRASSATSSCRHQCSLGPGRRGGVGRFELLGQGNRQGRRCEGQHSGSSSSVDRCVHCMLSSMPNSE